MFATIYSYFFVISGTKPIVIISDIRRKNDIKYFKENSFNIRTVRISASDEIRENRGWKFENNVDNVQSECDLDDYNQWDLYIENNGEVDAEILVQKVLELLK